MLINALTKIKYESKDNKKLSTMFKELVDTLLDMLGLSGSKKDNMYEYVLDAYASMLEQQVGDTNSGVLFANNVAEMQKQKAKDNEKLKDIELSEASKKVIEDAKKCLE